MHRTITHRLISACVLLALAACLWGCLPIVVAPTMPAAKPTVAQPTPTTDHGVPSPTRPNEGQWAEVLRVVDGDTITVLLDGEVQRVRYIGINAPESVKPDSPVEFMGPEASDANEALVGERKVWLERDVSDTDKYGRLLRYVWIDDLMVNGELVRLGYAHAGTYPPDVKHQAWLQAMEDAARAAERGLWGD